MVALQVWRTLAYKPLRSTRHKILKTNDMAWWVNSLGHVLFPFARWQPRPRPNSVKYGNSKTTTLLPSAKCTRPLFQGRTGCGGCPSGWHDIVTCQRLVLRVMLENIYYVLVCCSAGLNNFMKNLMTVKSRDRGNVDQPWAESSTQAHIGEWAGICSSLTGQ